MESRESAKLLLERNDINVNIPDNWNGRTALHWACYQRYPASVDLLLQRDDIDPNARDINGYAPLVIVCRVYGRCVDIVRSLLPPIATPSITMVSASLPVV